MEQKFLDREGVKVLWRQASLKDYPNNETLMAVIDAIDETKADKDELFSKSWNDLTDKPFYESTIISKQIIIEPTEHTFVKQFQGSEESGYQWIVRQSLSIDGSDYIGTFVDGEQINVLWNDTEYTAQVEVNGKGYPKLYLDIATISLPFEYSNTFDIIPVFDEYYDVLPDGMNVGDQAEVPVTFSIYKATNTSEIKQLDEKFIPSTIARTSDIVNSNWNENDENSKAHILNRTHYIDIVQAEIATVKNVSNSTKVQFECKNEFCFANTSAIKVTIKGSDDSILYEKELTRQKFDYSQPGVGLLLSTGWFGNVNLCDDSAGLNESNFPTDSDAPICVFGEEGGGGTIISPNIKFTNLSLRIDESLLSTTSDSYNVEIIDMDNMEDIYYPLDEKYIPETIARIADISEQVQSNYEENDSSSLAHIQNRPFYKKPNENQILADGNFTIELTTNWVEYNLTYYGAQLPFSVIEDDGLISKCEITINDVTYTASSSYRTDTNTYCFDYWASNGTQFSVLYDEPRSSYIIEFYGGFDFNIGDSIYVKIKDLREYIYKHLSEEFLPLTLKESWTLGENNDNSASGSLVAGYNNKNTNSNNITVGHSNDNAGQYSALIGVYNKTTASNTYLLGNQLIASKGGQTVLGKYNIEDDKGDSRQGSKLFIVGNGSSATRSNAHTLDVNGNAWFSGDIYVGSTSGTNKDTGSKKLATEDYVATELSDYYLKTEVDTLHTEIEDYVDNQVAALVNAAPETLDTLGELAAAFNENKEVVEALDGAITTKANQSDLIALQTTVTSNTSAINTLQTETWTFTLNDGTTVTKQMVVK